MQFLKFLPYQILNPLILSIFFHESLLLILMFQFRLTIQVSKKFNCV